MCRCKINDFLICYNVVTVGCRETKLQFLYNVCRLRSAKLFCNRVI